MDFMSLMQARPGADCRLRFPMKVAKGLRQQLGGIMRPGAKLKLAIHLGTRLGRAMNAEG